MEDEDSFHNTISENTIMNNNVYGIYTNCYSPNGNIANRIYHNNFINNIKQVYVKHYNDWDDGYPSGGNYWSDYDEPGEGAYDNYHGPDQDLPGSDGIADEPYYIGDRYPLMEPYTGGDTTSPNLEIIEPKNALYIMNIKIRPYLLNFRKPLIIGKIDIEVNATDNKSGIDRVEFYIDDELIYTDTSEPYSWTWEECMFFRHIIKVIAYDIAENSAMDEIQVWKFF